MASRFGRRIRKGAAGTAVAAAAMAALTASQAPGLASGAARPVPPGPGIDGGSPYITRLPPLGSSPSGSASPSPGTSGSSGSQAAPTGGAGIPAIVLAAYRRAEATLARTRPGCHLPWQLLAAIGQVESGQAEGGDVDLAGTTLHRILGPVLAGGRFADIPDTDDGRWDGDPVHDRAVGPMQFIPSTWATWGADGNGDGVKDPDNVFDAALAAGDYLCAAGGDLSVPANMRRAILGYNHSDAYVRTVESWYTYFLKGVHEVPDSASGVGIAAPSPGRSGSPGPSVSPSPSPSKSPGHSPTPTVSASGSVGPVSSSPSPSSSGSPTGCPTTSPSPTASASPSTSPSTTPSGPPTGCPTTSPSPTASASPTAAPSGSAGPSASATSSASASVAPTDPPSTGPSGSCPPSPTPSDSVAPAP